MSRPTCQRGVTLIEVMVALVVIAIGALSLTGLQLVSKRNTLDAAQHSHAAALAHDLFERVRGNSSIEGLTGFIQLAAGGLGGGTQANGAQCSVDAPCDARALASSHLREWEAALDGAAEQIGDEEVGGLLDGRACFEGPGVPGRGIYTLTIVWRGGLALPEDADAPACGAALGIYGENNELRRILQVQTYLAQR